MTCDDFKKMVTTRGGPAGVTVAEVAGFVAHVRSCESCRQFVMDGPGTLSDEDKARARKAARELVERLHASIDPEITPAVELFEITVIRRGDGDHIFVSLGKDKTPKEVAFLFWRLTEVPGVREAWQTLVTDAIMKSMRESGGAMSHVEIVGANMDASEVQDIVDSVKKHLEKKD